MQAMQLTAPGFANLSVIELPTPAPAAGEVLIRLRAASLNFLDLAVALGQFPGVSYPLVPVTDGAGEIAAIGGDVTDVRPGDRVIPHFMPAWLDGPISSTRVDVLRGVTAQGSLAEYVTVPSTSIVPIPAQLSFEQAATLPIAATTAWNALKAGGVRPGSTVLLLGTGGVSIFALQLAKAAGAHVLITSSSDAKLERAIGLGADHVVNYRKKPEWDKEVLRMTDGRGADLVIESIGAQTFVKSLASVAFGGTVFLIGFVSGVELQFSALPILQKAIRVQGNNTGSVADLREVARAIEVNGIHPIVDRTFELTAAASAYEALSQATHFGKLAVAVERTH